MESLSVHGQNVGDSKCSRGRGWQTRLASLDIARIISITAVVSMHINESTLDGTVRDFAVSFGSIGVPVFVMLTGYLMLGRDYDNSASIKRFLKRSLLPLFVALQLWNIVWAILGWVTGSPAPVSQVIRAALFLGEIRGAFWFMFMIMGLYLGLPLIDMVIIKLKQDHMRPYSWLIGVALVYFGLFIPTVEEVSASLGIVTNISPTLEIGLFGMTAPVGGSIWILYLVIGSLIREHAPHGARGVIVSASLLVVSLALLTWMRGNAYDAEVYFSPANYANALVAVSAASLICMLRSIEEKLCRLPGKFKDALARMSAATFGVYMIHFTVFGQLLNKIPFLFAARGVKSFLLLGVATLAISYAISICLSYIPGISSYLMLAKVRPSRESLIKQ